jgi:hypothetical protein
MATDKLSTQTQITIIAALDGNNNVQLFLANNVAALDPSDTVKDGFAGRTKDASVTVTVMSTSGAVSVSSSSSSGLWQNSQSVASGDVTLYFAQATYDMPSKGNTEKDTFTISVGGYTADPTVVISRGGTGNNVVIAPGLKQG